MWIKYEVISHNREDAEANVVSHFPWQKQTSETNIWITGRFGMSEIRKFLNLIKHPLPVTSIESLQGDYFSADKVHEHILAKDVIDVWTICIQPGKKFQFMCRRK